MLTGYRTYITLLAGAIFKILESKGIVEIKSQDLEAFIYVAIFAIAALFRYFATKKNKVGGSTNG